MTEALRHPAATQAEAGNENVTNQEETNRNRDMNSVSRQKGKEKGRGKGRGKAGKHGRTAMVFSRSWTEVATEEYNRQLELDRYFR